MKKEAISERDLTALLALGIILSLAFGYFLGVQVFMKSSREVGEVNRQLEIKLADIQMKEKNRPQYEKETLEYNKKIDDIVYQFQNKVTTEKVIYDIDALQKELAPMQVDAVTLDMNQVFYPQVSESSSSSSSDEGLDSGENSGQASDSNSSASGGYQDGRILVYRSLITVTFRSLSYNNLKKMIDHVHNYDGRLTMEDLEIQFESDSGLLTGVVNFNFYSLEGGPKEYQVPEINGISSGLKNIFGTFDKKK